MNHTSVNYLIYFILLILSLYCMSNHNNNIKKNMDIKKNINNGPYDNYKLRNNINYGLKIIDKIFNENGIYYTIAYGTLLGAVRHWKMIEWDDDADIHILRKDIDKILNLKSEFLKYGLVVEKDWKLLKIYFNDKKYPFIDLFPIDNMNGKTKRCGPKSNTCTQINEKWWTSWYGFPFSWLEKRVRFKFGKIYVWGPINYIELLHYWYGKRCLTTCYSSNFDHITGYYLKPKIIPCKNLPKSQLSKSFE